MLIKFLPSVGMYKKPKTFRNVLKSVIKMVWIHIVGPDLDANCLQKVFADDTGKDF